MATDPHCPNHPTTPADDSDELLRCIHVLREAYQRSAHVDAVILGESDVATVTCWSSSCPAADQKADFLRWLADTTYCTGELFVPEQDQ